MFPVIECWKMRKIKFTQFTEHDNSTNRPFASLSHSLSSSSNAFISHNAPINSVGASLSSVLSNTMDEIRDVVIDLQHAKIKLIAHTSGSVSVNKVPIQCSCSWENGNGNQAILTMRWWLVHLVIGAQCQHTRTHTHSKRSTNNKVSASNEKLRVQCEFQMLRLVSGVSLCFTFANTRLLTRLLVPSAEPVFRLVKTYKHAHKSK